MTKTINLNSRTTTFLQLTLQSMPRQKGVIDEIDENEKDHFAISKEEEEYDDGTDAKKDGGGDFSNMYKRRK